MAGWTTQSAGWSPGTLAAALALTGEAVGLLRAAGPREWRSRSAEGFLAALEHAADDGEAALADVELAAEAVRVHRAALAAARAGLAPFGFAGEGAWPPAIGRPPVGTGPGPMAT
jgi:hypothetical protein